MLFTLLTWCRTSEKRFAAWTEFEELDGNTPLWIPGERMKMDREHIAHFRRKQSHYCAAVCTGNREDLVFPGAKPGKPISQNTLIYACCRMGYRGRQTVHGFRGMASTWANEQEIYNLDWIDMALAHSEDDDIRGAYNSALYLTPRRRMLQHWADTVSQADKQLAEKSNGDVAEAAPVTDMVLATHGGSVFGLSVTNRFEW